MDVFSGFPIDFWTLYKKTKKIPWTKLNNFRIRHFSVAAMGKKIYSIFQNVIQKCIQQIFPEPREPLSGPPMSKRPLSRPPAIRTPLSQPS